MSGRQIFPYQIMEELPVIRPESMPSMERSFPNSQLIRHVSHRQW